MQKVAIKKSKTSNSKKQPHPDERPGMTLRLPIDLREAITEESRVKGDLARIVLFALQHVDKNDVEIMQTRKAGLPLTNPQIQNSVSSSLLAATKSGHGIIAKNSLRGSLSAQTYSGK